MGLIKYYPEVDANARPYLGTGIGYTFLFENQGYRSDRIGGLAYAFEGGLLVPITKNFGTNFNIAYISRNLNYGTEDGFKSSSFGIGLGFSLFIGND